MSSDTILKLLRWRVRDLAACFFASEETPGIDHEEPNRSASTNHHQSPRKTMVFDPIKECRRNQTDEEKLRTKKSNQKKVSMEHSQEITRKSEEGLSRLSSRSHFKEEEYIVFCLNDDGTIHLGKENSTSEASNATMKSRANAENACDQSCVDAADEHMDDEESIAVNGQIEEEGSNDVEVGWPPDEIKEINHVESHGDQAKRLSSMLSAVEASDSGRSDASSGSFAFPVLRWEWMESLVNMPKPEDTELRAHRARGKRLHLLQTLNASSL